MKKNRAYSSKNNTSNQRMGFVSPPPPSLRGVAGMLLLIHSLLSVLFQISWYSIPDGLFGIAKKGMDGYVISAIIMQGICILMPTLLTMLLFRLPPEILTGSKKSTPTGLLMSFTVGIPAAFVFVGINNGFVYLLTVLNINLPSTQLSGLTIYQGTNSLFLIIIVGALLPGIIEELMFRGVIQGVMESFGGRLSAILLQAFAFSIFHADPLFILAPFLAGLLLGFIRSKTGSIYNSILAHISLNITILVMHPLFPKITPEYFETTPSLQILYASLLAAFVSAVALIPMILIFSYIPQKSPPKNQLRVYFPADWKFVLASLVLISNLLFVYFSNL